MVVEEMRRGFVGKNGEEGEDLRVMNWGLDLPWLRGISLRLLKVRFLLCEARFLKTIS